MSGTDCPVIQRHIAGQRTPQAHRCENLTNGTANSYLETKYNEAAVTILGEFAVKTKI
jgi:hypothetical protein